MTRQTQQEVRSYINGLRNDSKRAYAGRCLAAIESGCDLDTVPRGDVSYMGAQAVRIGIAAIKADAIAEAEDTLTNWEREQVAASKAVRDGSGIKLVNPDMVTPPVRARRFTIALSVECGVADETAVREALYIAVAETGPLIGEGCEPIDVTVSEGA